ncbi:MAG: hypothetical protein OQK04_16740 [Kangiellaceae bacterium]|nr:hypothetical protein [Kangiellaceae bacterium]MCW9000359.1 hypothetical protein [Kangiellaceae bacterium]
MKYVISLILILTPTFASADTASGKVSMLEVPTNTDVNTIYFKLDPMPANVTQVFYIRYGTGTSSGCTVMGSEKQADRAFSLLLSAKAQQKNVTVRYCLDSNGYGLVNSSVRLD